LQHEDVNPDTVVIDTVIRSYSVDIPEYRLQPLDVLDIRIESLTNPDLDFFSKSLGSESAGNLSTTNAAIQGELIDVNGEISFPVVGKIKVKDLTLVEAQVKLQEISSRFLQDPVVKLRLLNFRFTIMGEVNQETTVTTFNSTITMMEAIGLAGGLTDLGDRSKVKLIRQRDGIVETQYLNLLDENFIQSPYYYVYQNDVIIVPPLKQRPYHSYFRQNLGIVLTSITTILLAINLFVK